MVYYYYYYKGNKIESSESTNLNIYDLVGKYYEVDISTKNLLYSRIQLDKEVTDTVKIKTAGFKLEKEIPKEKPNQFQKDNSLK